MAFGEPIGDEPIRAALESARGYGFLGPGPIDQHITHSRAFLALLPERAATAVDLGSGGGVPGLVLAAERADLHWILLDAQQRRVDFLAATVRKLGFEDRVAVCCQRAEEAGRGPMRGAVDVVVARGFAGPGATAECAAPFLRQGGALIVAEPPGAPDRWSPSHLSQLGLRLDHACTAPVALRRLLQEVPCPDRYPRRNGLPRKRPLF